MTAPSEIIGYAAVALLQVKNARKLTLDDVGAVLGVTRVMAAQYIAGDAEMGFAKWVRATEEWPELADRFSDQLKRNGGAK